MAEWMRAHGETAQVVVFFGLLGAMVVAERLAPYRASRGGRRWVANYGLTLLNLLMLGVLPLSFIAVAELAQARGVGLLNGWALPLPWLIAANLLLRGFISFITHLLMHKVPLFWRVHRVHHLDTELDVSTTVRFHPLEQPIGVLVGAPLVLAFGLDPWILMLYELVDVVVTLWSHGNLRTPAWLERILRYLVVTPQLHRVHHSTVVEETDSNFSAVFPIWDVLFGTFRPRPKADPATMPFGLGEVRDARSHSLGWLLTVPFRRLDGSVDSSAVREAQLAHPEA